MANPVTANKGYPLPVGNLADDLGRVTEAFEKIDADMAAAGESAQNHNQQTDTALAAHAEKLRKARLNALLGEDLLPL
ncbi:hypothetical protein [Rheinheimera sp.]|uniref:hypothetical protein n=1 Tax=Rheinheimera sp. TaxID=1869214 RepID=UPI00307F7785